MNYTSTIHEVAAALNLIDGNGKLKPLDSLTIMDLVVGLEDKIGFEIPTLELRADTFESIESIAEMLTEVRENS